MTPVKCDENGFVRGFPHHDGRLDGVLTDDVAKEAHLAIRSVDGERRVLALRGVVALHVEGFREGNILSNLRLLTLPQVLLDEELRRLFDERLFIDVTTLRPDVVVFVVESSFGADVLAVCGGVHVSEPGARLVLSGCSRATNR